MKTKLIIALGCAVAAVVVAQDCFDYPAPDPNYPTKKAEAPDCESITYDPAPAINVYGDVDTALEFTVTEEKTINKIVTKWPKSIIAINDQCEFRFGPSSKTKTPFPYQYPKYDDCADGM